MNSWNSVHSLIAQDASVVRMTAQFFETTIKKVKYSMLYTLNIVAHKIFILQLLYA